MLFAYFGLHYAAPEVDKVFPELAATVAEGHAASQPHSDRELLERFIAFGFV